MKDYLINHFEEWYLNDLLGNKIFLDKATNSRKTTYSNPIIESLYNSYIQENREKLSYAIDIYLNYEIYFSFIEKLKMSLYYDEKDDGEITDDEINDLLDDVEQTQVSDENVEKNKLIKSVGDYQVRDGLSEYIDDFSVVIDDDITVYQYRLNNFEKHLIDYCITSYFGEEIAHENRYCEFKDLVRDFYYSIPKADLDKLSILTKINLAKVIEHITDDAKKKNGGILYS